MQLDYYKESNINYLNAARLNYKKSEAYQNVAVTHYYAFNDTSKAIFYLKLSLSLNPEATESKKFLKKILKPSQAL